MELGREGDLERLFGLAPEVINATACQVFSVFLARMACCMTELQESFVAQ